MDGLLRNLLLCSLVMALAACTSDDPGEVNEGDKPDDSISSNRLMILDTLAFGKQKPLGVAPGFNLDNRVSDKDDEQTCGKADFVSPDGPPGIDNQAALLVPLFDLTGLGALEGLIQAAVDDGGLLIMLGVAGVDDLFNDDDVQLKFRIGKGKPLLGTDGLVLSGQTFHLHPDSPESLAKAGRIENGVLHAGPFQARLPLVVFGIEYVLTFRNAMVRADMTYDGGLENGVMGGLVDIDNILLIGKQAEKGQAGLENIVKTLVTGLGDLDRDANGVCQQMSATLMFSAVSGYLFGEHSKLPGGVTGSTAP